VLAVLAYKFSSGCQLRLSHFQASCGWPAMTPVLLARRQVCCCLTSTRTDCRDQVHLRLFKAQTIKKITHQQRLFKWVFPTGPIL
jgi:hypothetical protein